MVGINKTNHGQHVSQVSDVSKMNFLQRLIAVILGKVTFEQAFAGKNLSDRNILVGEVVKDLEEGGIGNLPPNLGINPDQSPEDIATVLVSMALDKPSVGGFQGQAKATAESPKAVSELAEEIADLRPRLNEANKRLRGIIDQAKNPRASAQLYLILAQFENVANCGNASEIKAALDAVEKIGLSLIEEAAREADKAEERKMDRTEFNISSGEAINIRSDQANIVEGNSTWEQTFCGRLHLPSSLRGNERPCFPDLALAPGKRRETIFVLMTKLIKGINDVLKKSDDKCGAFLATEIAKNAAENRNFDLPIRFKADLFSQLGPKHLNTIEDMAEKHSEEFKAFAILAALWSHFGMSDQSGYSSPQLPPAINPVVQRLAQMLRNDNITAQDLNETFGKLLEEHRKAITGQ